MRVWLIHMGELVQSDGPGVRLYRLGLLAEALEAEGHQVTRWIPTFIHTHKRQRFLQDTVVNIAPRYEIRHIYSRGYQQHRGVGRLRFHREVARRWEVLQREVPAPDVILAGMPTPDICAAARRIGAERGVPVVIDVRDLWPDTLYHAVPSWAVWVARMVTTPMLLANRRSFRAAAAITAVSQSYLDWGLHLANRPKSGFDRVFPLGYEPPAAPAEDIDAAESVWASKLSKGATICLFLGTMSAQYDLVTLLGAARQLARSCPGRFEWVIDGDGPTRSALVRAASDLPNVWFPGWVGGADVVALLRLATVGIAPYASGALMSLPNKPFEYAWASLPVVSSLGGELSALLEQVGFGRTYSPGDSAALAAILQAYDEDPDLRLAHGQAARTLWEDQYSGGQIYGSMVRFLEHLTGSSPSQRLAAPQGETGPVGNRNASGVQDSAGMAVANPDQVFDPVVLAGGTCGSRKVRGKRAFDVAASAACLAIASPVLACCALGVCLTSPGPVFYRGARVGLHGREFKIFKFRSMWDRPTTQLTTGLSDPRVTPFGRFLRRYKLDEWPQLINVLRGDMSFVGPRPEFRQWVDLYSSGELKILSVRPGITDFACLEFIDLDAHVGSENADERYLTETFPRKNSLRLKYVDEMSWRTDLGLIAQTAVRSFRRRR